MDGAPVSSDGGANGGRLRGVSRRQEDAILAALGDPPSRALLLELNVSPRSAQELIQRCALPQATVYRKLRELQDAELVGVQRSVITADGHRTDLFRSRLIEARLRYEGSRLEVRAAFRDLSSERMADLWDAVRRPESP